MVCTIYGYWILHYTTLRVNWALCHLEYELDCYFFFFFLGNINSCCDPNWQVHHLLSIHFIQMDLSQHYKLRISPIPSILALFRIWKRYRMTPWLSIQNDHYSLVFTYSSSVVFFWQHLFFLLFKNTQMKLLTVALLFVVVLSSVQSQDGVLILNDKNFNEVISEHNMVLVMFYAPVRTEQLCNA